MPHSLSCTHGSTHGTSCTETTPLDPIRRRTSKPYSGSRNGAPSQPSGALNSSTNVILLYRLHEVKALSAINVLLAVLTLLNLGTCLTLFVLNAMNNNDADCGDPGKDDVAVARCGSPVSDLVFHTVEFWASFVYACVEAAALVYTPRAISTISQRPLVLRILLFFDIVATFVPALLVSVNLQKFEVAAHETEFLNELTMALVNLILLQSLVRRRRGGRTESARAAKLAGGAACAAPLFQLAVYNSPLESGEKIAHFCEFCFGMATSFVTFWFCLDNWSAAEEEIHCILYGADACPGCDGLHLAKARERADSGGDHDLSLNARARERAALELA